MPINKIDNLTFVRIIKKRLEESKFNINITKTDINQQINYYIEFSKQENKLSKFELSEQINDLTSNLIAAYNGNVPHPIVYFGEYSDDFLENPNSLLYELFNTIKDSDSREGIYKSLYSNIDIIESFNEVTNIINRQLYPGKDHEIIKFLLKEEVKEELNEQTNHISTLHAIVGYLSKIKPEDRHVFQEEFFEVLKKYLPLIINEDNKKKGSSHFEAIRDNICSYITRSNVDKQSWNLFRQFFPVGKNNAHLTKPTENQLFINPEYKIHSIVLSNLSIMSYYENILSNKMTTSMVEEIVKLLNKKEHAFFQKLKIGILESNEDSQSIWVKINQEENQEKVLKEVKTLIIGMMDSYQNCLEQQDKEKKHYLDKACDTILLGLRLSYSEKVMTKENKPNKI